MKRLALLSMAVGGLTCAAPAAAQTPEKVDIMDAGLASVLAICVPVIESGFDINDATALAPFGFRPWSGAEEAEVQASIPGLEVASADTDQGSVVIGVERGLCTARFTGDEALSVRKELVRQLTATGVRQERSDKGGSITLAFYFTDSTIFVDNRDGKVMVQVRRAHNR